MKLSEVRERYLEFFSKKGRDHSIIPSASLVPENDPTTLFTGSGMQPLLPYLLGAEHPAGRRLVNSQKCFRAEDIEEVGDNRHTTFFEMLGNWSFGDYFKEKQISWFWEFLTEGLGLDPNRIFVTCYSGNPEAGIPKDTESALIWKELFSVKGIEAKEIEVGTEKKGYEMGEQGGRIFFYTDKNWWSRAGKPDNMPTGEPGGPDTEMFYLYPSVEHDSSFGENCHPNCDCGRYIELGNSVFMQYIKTESGFDDLPSKNVDYGGGLERITAAVNDTPDVFRVDVFVSIINEIEKLSGKNYSLAGSDPARHSELTKSFRVVADHLRGAVFMIADGVLPGNTERNYFVRRLIRRAVRHMDLLQMEPNTLGSLSEAVVKSYGGYYTNLKDRSVEIKNSIEEEESKFRLSIKKGVQEFERMTKDGEAKAISGKEAFDLYQSYGFPIDMTVDLAEERGFTVDREAFEIEFVEHQKISRAGAEKKFKGGLVDHSEMSIKYHTATHLLHQALRDVLGDSALQRGSNITPERLRFDFAFDRKMTEEEKQKTEEIVNQKIKDALPVDFEIIPLDEANRRGAIGLFMDQYGDKVKVYKMGEKAKESLSATSPDSSLADTGLYSLEFCGGPHVSNTSELGTDNKKFKITKEEAVSAGVRRIRAVLE